MLDSHVAAAPGVVHQDIYPPKCLDGPIHHELDVRGLGYVDLGGDCLASELADLSGHLRNLLLLDVGEQHVRAFGGELKGNGSTEALGGACDDGDVALESHD